MRKLDSLRLFIMGEKMPKIYSKRTKQKVRSLRSQGWSLREISLKTRIPKNTVSGWVKDIKLTKEQQKRIRQKIVDSAAIGRPLAARLLRQKIEEWKQEIRTKTKHFGKLQLHNPEIGKFICGLLYLCEGAKYPSTRALIFINSNPEIIYCFLNLLRNCFKIKEDKLRCRIMYRCDQNIKKLKKYWSNITKIPLRQFFDTKPDIRTKGKPTKKKDYMGVCSIQYGDTTLQYQLQSIGEVIIKNGAGGI